MGIIAVGGDLVEDIIVWASGEIAYGTDTPSKIFRVRGGSASNTAEAVRAAGGDPRLLTRVGMDDVGVRLVEQLQRSGVDVRAQRGGTTGTIVILIDSTGERTMLPDRATAKQVEPFEPSWLEGTSWLHLPLYGFETPGEAAVFTELAAEAARRGIPLSIDVSSTGLIEIMGRDRVRDLLTLLQPSLVFANAEEAALLELETTDPPAGCTLVLKHGGDPVTLRMSGATLSVEVPPVPPAADTTGAGDHFAAGFLTAIVAGADLEAAARSGIEAATRVLQTPGASVTRIAPVASE